MKFHDAFVTPLQSLDCKVLLPSDLDPVAYLEKNEPDVVAERRIAIRVERRRTSRRAALAKRRPSGLGGKRAKEGRRGVWLARPRKGDAAEAAAETLEEVKAEEAAVLAAAEVVRPPHIDCTSFDTSCLPSLLRADK